MAEEILNKDTLLAKLKNNSHKIRSYGVSKLGLFGSFVTGENKQNSDVDLLVEFYPTQKNYDNYIDLSFYLEELLGRKIDLVTPQSLSKYIGPHILNQTEYVAI